MWTSYVRFAWKEYVTLKRFMNMKEKYENLLSENESLRDRLEQLEEKKSAHDIHYEKVFYVEYKASAISDPHIRYLTKEQLRWMTERIDAFIIKVEYIWDIMVNGNLKDFLVMTWLKNINDFEPSGFI